jgi:hypothetical protein
MAPRAGRALRRRVGSARPAPGDPGEFQSLDLRCHAVLKDVPLHDVWAIDLRGGGPGRTMSDVMALSRVLASAPNPAVGALFAVRRAFGRLLRWDREQGDWRAGSYANRLTDVDRARTLIDPGTRQGAFRLLYLFEDEALAEVRNATVHAFLASALVARSGGYVLYWAIYVKPVGAFTPVYMATIDPFRRLVVYPALIRQLQAAWSRRYDMEE